MRLFLREDADSILAPFGGSPFGPGGRDVSSRPFTNRAKKDQAMSRLASPSRRA